MRARLGLTAVIASIACLSAGCKGCGTAAFVAYTAVRVAEAAAAVAEAHHGRSPAREEGSGEHPPYADPSVAPLVTASAAPVRSAPEPVPTPVPKGVAYPRWGPTRWTEQDTFTFYPPPRLRFEEQPLLLQGPDAGRR